MAASPGKVTGSLVATGASNELGPCKAVSISLTGTWAGTVQAQRSLDNGVTWANIPNAVWTTNVETMLQIDVRAAIFRLDFTRTSGTLVLAVHADDGESAAVFPPTISSAGSGGSGVASGSRAEFDLVLSLDTNAYAAGDVLFDTQEIVGFFAAVGAFATLEELQVYDEDDQGQPIDLFFFNAATALGTENSAPNISDANARTIIGNLSIVADNYKDLGGSKRANLIDIEKRLKSAASTSLWVAGVTQGAPTHAAAGMRLRFTVRY